MLDSEVRPSAPTDKLVYEVAALDRWVTFVGAGCHIVQWNDAADWSLLMPL